MTENLCVRAKRTMAYLHDAFVDPDVIPFFDAKAISDVPEESKIFLRESGSSSNFYTRIDGEPELVSSLSGLAKSQNILFSNPENILVTAGAMNAFSALCYALCDPGDVILALSPSYILFAKSAEMFGATLDLIPSYFDGKFKPCLESLKNAIDSWRQKGKQVKAILVVNPTNIDGQCWTLSEVQAVSEIALQCRIPIIEDRVYNGLEYDPPVDASFFSSFAPVASQVISIDSVSKRFGATQWRIGWIFGPKNIIEKARDFVLQSVWSPASAYQKAAAYLIDSQLRSTFSSVYLANVQEKYRKTRDLALLLIHGARAYEEFKERKLTPLSTLRSKLSEATWKDICELEAGELLTPVIPQAGMFLLIGFSNEVWNTFPSELEEVDLVLARILYQREKVVLIPPSETTLPDEVRLFRMEFGVPTQQLIRGIKRLHKFVRYWKSLSRGEVLEQVRVAQRS